MKKIKNKKAAMEMSVGTIVTVVLLMTVLILGLMLVRNIFGAAKYNIEEIDNKLRGEIARLFVEEQRMVVYLSNNKLEVKQGKDWGVAWAVKNTMTASVEEQRLGWEVMVHDLGKCEGILDERKAMNFIELGAKPKSTIRLSPGQTHLDRISFLIPENAPICTIRYRIETYLNNEPYETVIFDVAIKSK